MSTCDCGHEPTPTEPGHIGTGYAMAEDRTTGKLSTMCWPCADAIERIRLQDEKVREFGAFLSLSGESITTWSGGKLAHVTRASSSNAGFYDSKITHVRAVTPDGRRWWGRNGGPGCFITLRLAKNQED